MEKFYTFSKETVLPNVVFIHHGKKKYSDAIKNGRPLMDLASKSFRASGKRIGTKDYAFQVVGDSIINVYRVNGWKKSNRFGRIDFDLLDTVPSHIKNKYIGNTIKLKNQNPIQYN